MAHVEEDRSLHQIDLSCTHCNVRMIEHQVPGSRVRYFRCDSCRRCFASSYAEVLTADAKVRTSRGEASGEQRQRFEGVKAKMERWIACLDEQDPYRALGVSPRDPVEAIRARYRELALRRHPDRGGSPDQMRELNQAYERILSHLDQQSSTETALPVQVAALPARRR